MSPTSEKLQVLIVGAGPTGLTAALYLVQHGISVRIIERSPKEHGGARGTAIVVRVPVIFYSTQLNGLKPRTQELLKILGADKDVFEIATGPLQMAVYGPDGKTISKAFNWSEPAEDSPTIPFVGWTCWCSQGFI